MISGIGFQVPQARILEPYQIGVLLVEDKFLLQINRVQCLTDAGLFPFLAATAEDALELLDQRGDIRVVVTEATMHRSGMDGFELARIVAGRWPHIGFSSCQAPSVPREATSSRERGSSTSPAIPRQSSTSHSDMSKCIRPQIFRTDAEAPVSMGGCMKNSK